MAHSNDNDNIKTKTYVVWFETTEDVTAEQLHEAICKGLYEGVGADETLGDMTKIVNVSPDVEEHDEEGMVEARRVGGGGGTV